MAAQLNRRFLELEWQGLALLSNAARMYGNKIFVYYDNGIRSKIALHMAKKTNKDVLVVASGNCDKTRGVLLFKSFSAFLNTVELEAQINGNEDVIPSDLKVYQPLSGWSEDDVLEYVRYYKLASEEEISNSIKVN